MKKKKKLHCILNISFILWEDLRVEIYKTWILELSFSPWGFFQLLIFIFISIYFSYQ